MIKQKIKRSYQFKEEYETKLIPTYLKKTIKIHLANRKRPYIPHSFLIYQIVRSFAYPFFGLYA